LGVNLRLIACGDAAEGLADREPDLRGRIGCKGAKKPGFQR
jgi:hypothetical protein